MLTVDADNETGRLQVGREETPDLVGVGVETFVARADRAVALKVLLDVGQAVDRGRCEY